MGGKTDVILEGNQIEDNFKQVLAKSGDWFMQLMSFYELLHIEIFILFVSIIEI